MSLQQNNQDAVGLASRGSRGSRSRLFAVSSRCLLLTAPLLAVVVSPAFRRQYGSYRDNSKDMFIAGDEEPTDEMTFLVKIPRRQEH